jgi:glycosyltransferase involved in cell wall biosynthesis
MQKENKEMKVSVVLPIYNVEPYLARCLDTLINQTLADIEIICVNDASPDDSAKILNEYASHDSRIKVITMAKNSGAAVARQAGVNIATGEYIGFVDPDDYVEIDFFEKLYELAKRENADIAKGAVITVDLSGAESITSNALNNQIRENKFKFFGQNLWDAIYRMDMVRAHNVHFEIDIFCFGLQATFYANKIAVRDDAFYKYVRREDSCDSNVFSVHKWEHWNVRGARYYMTLLNTLDYTPVDYVNIAAGFVFPLYFWGYDRLTTSDRKQNIAKMARYMIEFGGGLKYRDLFRRKFAEYNRAMLSGNHNQLVRLLKCRFIKTKFIKRALIKMFK